MMIFYCILSTPRTGSTLLCDYLAHTAAAGIRDINTATFYLGMGEDLKQNGVNYYQQYIQTQRTPNDVVGCKLMFDYIDYHLIGQIGIEKSHMMLDNFTHFILLQRKDVVGQAVSYHIAQRSTIWNSRDASQRQAKPVTYDYDQIAWKIAFIEGMQARYRSWLQLRCIEPLLVTYEDVIQNPVREVLRIFDYIKVKPPDPLPIKTVLKKLTDPRKEDYANRFVTDHTDRDIAARSADPTHHIASGR